MTLLNKANFYLKILRANIYYKFASTLKNKIFIQTEKNGLCFLLIDA